MSKTYTITFFNVGIRQRERKELLAIGIVFRDIIKQFQPSIDILICNTIAFRGVSEFLEVPCIGFVLSLIAF